MSNPPGLSIKCYRPNGQAVGNDVVDAWELKASRRALHNLKTLLVGQPMLDLLQKQIEDADAYYKKLITESHGQYKESRIDLKTRGVTSKQFIEWQRSFMEGVKTPEQRHDFFLNTVAPAHPEHYSLPPYDMGIIETIGERIARVRVYRDSEVPEFVLE